MRSVKTIVIYFSSATLCDAMQQPLLERLHSSVHNFIDHAMAYVVINMRVFIAGHLVDTKRMGHQNLAAFENQCARDEGGSTRRPHTKQYSLKSQHYTRDNVLCKLQRNKKIRKDVFGKREQPSTFRNVGGGFCSGGQSRCNLQLDAIPWRRVQKKKITSHSDLMVSYRTFNNCTLKFTSNVHNAEFVVSVGPKWIKAWPIADIEYVQYHISAVQSWLFTRH